MKAQTTSLKFRTTLVKVTNVLIPSLILGATALLSGSLATWTTLRSSNETIERYVSVWEEEVARNLLLKGDRELFEKIRAQIKDLASEVVSASPSINTTALLTAKSSPAVKTTPSRTAKSSPAVSTNGTSTNGGSAAAVNTAAVNSFATNPTAIDKANADSVARNTTAANLATEPKECFAEQNVNVTLYGTPAGQLRICRSPEKLLLRSLGSPVFAFGLLTGILFALWLTRRRAREESTRAVNDLAIRVAHDIRAPLMALKMAASTVAAEESSQSAGQFSSATLGRAPGASDARALIDSATKRISNIADDLLAIARPDVRKPELKVIAPIAKSIEAAIHELIREKKQTATMPIRFDVTPAKIADESKPALSSNDFERVISNLLQNSIEATIEKSKSSDGEVKPRITVETVESETQIAVTIRDNGIGIPKDVLPRIGEVGFSYGKHGGNGVGLSSARRWAQSRGGELDIRSLEGTGTEVRLTLPRLQSPADLQ